jgi:hypothetical protein
MNLKDLLGFFLKDSNWIKKFLIGGAFCIVSLYSLFVRFLWGEGAFTLLFIYMVLGGFVALMLFPLGYGSRLVKAVFEKQDSDLPEWKGWPELFKEGAKIFGVALMYGLVVAVIIMGISFFAAKIPVLGALFSFLYIVTGFLMVVSSPFIAIAICRVIASGKFSSALDFSDIYKEFLGKAEDYIALSLLLMGVKTVMEISLGSFGYSYLYASGALWPMRDSFPLVKLLSPFATFWFLITVLRGYGKIYVKNKS